MNHLLSINIFLFLTNFALGQQSNLDPNLIKKNKVREVTIIIHIYKTVEFSEMKEWKGKSQYEHYDSNGNLIYFATYDTLGELELELWYQYDNYGNKLNEKGINHVTGISDSLKWVLTYDNCMLLKKESSNRQYKVEYFYNYKGQLVKEIKHNKMVKPPKSPINYSYDNKGNITELFRLDGDFKIREFFKYDEQNRKLEHKWIYVETESDTTGRVFLWGKYHYDKNGNLVQVENLGGYGSPPTTIYTYDNNGFITEISNANSNYKYINDQHGNRIKEIIESDGIVVLETEYVYIFW